MPKALAPGRDESGGTGGDILEFFLGIDVGGTAVKAILLNDRGERVARQSFPTGALDDSSACERLALDLASMAGRRAPAGIGLALPGVVRDGSMAMIPNLSLDLPLLVGSLSAAFPAARVTCLNDANAAALGELHDGAARGLSSFVFVTLGTGVGSGLVVGGRLVAGHHGAAGEIGHLKVAAGGRPCGCGGRGCLERYASALGLVQTYREARASLPGNLDAAGGGPGPLGPGPAHDTDALAVFDAYEAGTDPFATQAVLSFADALGKGLAQAACLLDPQAFVLGGGMSASAALYLDRVRESYRLASIPPCRDIEIRIASLGNDAGALGAAHHARVSEQPSDSLS